MSPFVRIILLFVLVYIFVSLFLQNFRGKTKNSDRFNHLPQTLVSCPVCGTFFHPDRGVSAGDQLCCSPRCAAQV